MHADADFSNIPTFECPFNCTCALVQDLNGVAAWSIASSLLPAYYRPAAGMALVSKGSLHLSQLTLNEHALGQCGRQSHISGQKPVHLNQATLCLQAMFACPAIWPICLKTLAPE